MDMPVGNSDRCVAVLVFLCIDWVTDIPVVSVGPVLTGCNCAEDWSFLRCPCSLQRQVPAVSELKVPQLQFVFCMLDIPVVQQRRVHSANCAADRRDPFLVGFGMPVVVQPLAPGSHTGDEFMYICLSDLYIVVMFADIHIPSSLTPFRNNNNNLWRNGP